MGKTVAQIVPTEAPSQSNRTELSLRQRHGRAVNAVANLLRARLRVPNIYIDPTGASLSKVDVLAADAAGSGDIHAVEVKLLQGPLTQSAVRNWIEQIKKTPAHYKYVAVNENLTSMAIRGELFFSRDGIGRVGLILFSEAEDTLPNVALAVEPERFRLPPHELAQVERYLNRTKPDMFVRV